jgi:branched-chain amino acid transport system ATP-binding protein
MPMVEPAVRPLLSVRGVTRRFGGLVAVSSVDLDVDAGEILGLIGPNGAGKSTLFKLIAGIDAPDAGTIDFNGVQISKRRADRVCRLGVASTHQIVRPFPHMSVLENVMVGAFYGRVPRPHDPQHARQISLEVLEFCGLATRASDPARVLTLAGRKRLEIARALATGPTVLLLDEVLAGLNHTETDRTIELVRSILARGTTIVMVEHNLRAVRGLCSRIAVMAQGKKIADGDPASVLADQSVIDAYLGTAHA